MVRYGSLPFAEAIEYLKAKVPQATDHWDDIDGQAHDHTFIVAGAAKADLLTDLHGAVLKGIEQGTTLEEFRRDFDAIVGKHGWTGWTGEGTDEGKAWRTKVIYGTNLRTSYQAGRLSQARAIQSERPYWRYRHNDTVTHPRPQHQAWNGKVLPADDPWWSSHYPPNGWGCRCYIETLAPRDLQREGITVDPAPDDGTYEHVDRHGEPHTLPKGIDYGWDHQPGSTRDLVAEVKARAERMPGGIGDGLARDMGKIDLGAFPPGPGAGRVTMLPGTGVGHARRVRDAFNALPQAAQDLVSAENYRVVAVPRLSAAASHLRTPTPPATFPGLTWDHLQGVTTADGHILIAQETVVGQGMASQVVPVTPDMVRGTVAHEVAHAVDRVHHLSADPAVTRALAADLAALNPAAMTPQERQDAAYVAQPPPRGPAEAVAEIFARRHGLRTAEALDLETALPRTAAALKILFDGLNL